ncbi:MAG: coproporphyrinogen dehydrogenase HemZ [Lachnospiraceae bacterium]|nr:coproporphyrinogen dehydrogenase HemZ [Lachnospiraceae bacterium]
MIYLIQNKKEYDNDFRVMAQAFFCNEKMVAIEDESEAVLPHRFILCGEYNDDMLLVSIFSGVDDDNNPHLAPVSIELSDDILINHRRIHAGLYKLLSCYTGRELPWGDLTGVRPTKLATERLEMGEDEMSIKSFFMEEHFATEQKADICIETAKREQSLLKAYGFEKGYLSADGEECAPFCLYIGIPFCPTRCLYCSFAAYPLGTHANRVTPYLEALEKEIEAVSKLYSGRKLISVYFGGGTPTALSAKELDRLLDSTFKAFDLSVPDNGRVSTKNGEIEFTVEAGRPDSITPEKLEVLKRHGITRISINPQTMRDETLDVIGRRHSSTDTINAFNMARDMGFDNINMDMIVGLPGESVEDVRYTLDKLKTLNPESITVHSLAIKRAARLNEQFDDYSDMVKGSTNEMLIAVDEVARELSMKPYYLYRQKNIPGNMENVGYAKEGCECIYNILIMEEKCDILALGAGGSTKYVFPSENRIERVENVKSVDDYIGRIDEMIKRKML